MLDKNGKFLVCGNPGKFYWHIYGQRTYFEVEPLKADVKLEGDGPYKFLS
jgi:hypothetical protein